MYIFFVKPLKDFPVYSLILVTLWLRYLQTRTKANCMYLSCQLFRTHHKTLKFQQKLLPLQKKNIGKPDRMQVFNWYSLKKNHLYQQCTSCASPVRNSVKMHFLAIWWPEFQQFFICCPPWGYHMETELSKQ